MDLTSIQRRLGHAVLRAMGRSAPNPSVGAVLVYARDDAEVLLTGSTEQAGGRHAEVVLLDAYDRVRARGPESGVRLFVSLEPCSVEGRTPACTDRVLKYPEITEVIAACSDPSLQGSGLEALGAGGRNARLDSGLLPPALQPLGFTGRIAGRGPRLHLKAAVTADGYMAHPQRPGERLMISGPRAQAFTMMLRSRVDAVAVGPGTTALDRPALDFRPPEESLLEDGLGHCVSGTDLFTELLLEHALELSREAAADRHYQPLRVMLLGRRFSELRTFRERQAELARETGRTPLYLTARRHLEEWAQRGMPCLILPPVEAENFAALFRRDLGREGLNEVLVEGGPRMLGAFEDQLVPGDRVYILRNTRLAASPAGDASDRFCMPAYLERLPELARFELGRDELSVREVPLSDA